MYEGPIKVIVENVQQQFDKAVLNAVQRYDIEVDPGELRKALEYDRDQYEAGYGDGYADGRAARDREIVRCRECGLRHTYMCRMCTHDGEWTVDDGFCDWGRRNE